jgi:hypothetical protein
VLPDAAADQAADNRADGAAGDHSLVPKAMPTTIPRIMPMGIHIVMDIEAPSKRLAGTIASTLDCRSRRT